MQRKNKYQVALGCCRVCFKGGCFQWVSDDFFSIAVWPCYREYLLTGAGGNITAKYQKIIFVWVDNICCDIRRGREGRCA